MTAALFRFCFNIVGMLAIWLAVGLLAIILCSALFTFLLFLWIQNL